MLRELTYIRREAIVTDTRRGLQAIEDETNQWQEMNREERKQVKDMV